MGSCCCGYCAKAEEAPRYGLAMLNPLGVGGGTEADCWAPGGAPGLVAEGGGASPWCCTRYCSRRRVSASFRWTALLMTGEVRLAAA